MCIHYLDYSICHLYCYIIGRFNSNILVAFCMLSHHAMDAVFQSMRQSVHAPDRLNFSASFPPYWPATPDQRPLLQYPTPGLPLPVTSERTQGPVLPLEPMLSRYLLMLCANSRRIRRPFPPPCPSAKYLRINCGTTPPPRIHLSLIVHTPCPMNFGMRLKFAAVFA